MSEYKEMVSELRAKFKRRNFYIEKRIGEGDRRKAFFSFVEMERRINLGARRVCHV